MAESHKCDWHNLLLNIPRRASNYSETHAPHRKTHRETDINKYYIEMCSTNDYLLIIIYYFIFICFIE